MRTSPACPDTALRDSLPGWPTKWMSKEKRSDNENDDLTLQNQELKLSPQLVSGHRAHLLSVAAAQGILGAPHLGLPTDWEHHLPNASKSSPFPFFEIGFNVSKQPESYIVSFSDQKLSRTIK